MVRTGHLKVGAAVLMLSFVPPALAIQAAFADEPARQVVYAETGEASWYGPGLKGKRTASGERFDPRKSTAAHPELPLGSKGTVTNLENGRSVEVTINDRGPGVEGRAIDLSKAAAEKIGMTHDGTAQVVIEATRAQAESIAEERIASAEPTRPKPRRRAVDEG